MQMTSPSPIRILSMDAKVKAVDIVGNLPEDGEWWVHYRKSGEGRSQKQRRLMGMWAGEWVAWLKFHKGDAYENTTKDDAYNAFKWRFVLPKLIAVDTMGIWQICEARIIQLNSMEAKLKFAGDWIHSDALSPDEYCKAMEEWEFWTKRKDQSDGRFQPSHPEDLYYAAMRGSR